MKIKFGIIFLIIISLSCASFVRYDVIIDDVIDENHLELNQYIAVHHLYMGIFDRMGLIGKFDTLNKAIVIKKILYNLSYEESVRFIFKDSAQKYVGIMAFSLKKGYEGHRVSMYTNLDSKTGEVVDDTKKFLNLYSKEFQIHDKVIIPKKNTSDLVEEAIKKVDAEKNLAASGTGLLGSPVEYNNMAHYYLFDIDTTNDDQIEDFLLQAIDMGDLDTQFVSRLTYAQYYLSQYDFSGAEVQIEKAIKMIDTYVNHDFSPLGDALFYTIEEFAILKLILDKEV